MHIFKITSIEETEQNIHKIIFENEKQLYLIGTAHVSKNSAELVESKIHEIKPDVVCIELDEQRFNSIKNRNKYENIDINSLFECVNQLIK